MTSGRRRDIALVPLAFFGLAVVMTWPLAAHPGSLARTDTSDGQFGVWNVAWVARAVVHSPLEILDANIFYPHRWALLYSETNLGAGLLAAPVYWITGSQYLAYNWVFLLSFAMSGAGAFLLTRHLAGDWRAAAVAGVAFAYCPYVLGHTAHIQLLMTAGLPFSLLAFHRLAESPSAGRGVALGAVMALQTLFCGYYAIFVVLIVAWAVLVTATVRGLWTIRCYWLGVTAAATSALVGAMPLLVLYAMFRSGTGFERGVEQARMFSADWRAYLTSGAYAGQWLWTLGLAVPREALFPGAIVTVAAVAALVTSRGWRGAEIAWLYGGLACLAAWASLGPDAGLYRVLYATVPGFGFMRAPSRIGLVVALAVDVLASVGVARFLARWRRPSLVGGCLIAATVAEMAAPLSFQPVPTVEPVYELLAKLPDGPVLELPIYSRPLAYMRAPYMLASTIHWNPIVDAYSDYTPPDFDRDSEILADFPTREALQWARREGVRYAVIHVSVYSPEARAALDRRLVEYAPYLAQHYEDDSTKLYEVIGAPP